ncbi:heterokaryon incompatibility protein-domain-containing protein [Xylariomycetidae sp. FL2044]|nr:heterokaryon incompatibility protein-domain-containing protein [Xylariomycetidae sp. FL2044]
MRLLNTSTLKLSEFFDDKVPKYAILSHTWDDDEVSFHEVETPAARTKKGFAKIQGCCSTALRSGYVWVWIDTCCIDKSSSAELSEAINSMFRWYREADMCYAYLSDSRWFTRGWTLQELLAPYFIEFHDMHWIYIGGKHNHNEAISEITQIPAHLIKHGWLISHSSAAECISWVSRRTTSRREDMAYCLLGLLDVSMPILYGEGHKAFLRLQEEIIKTRYDQTLLAWGLGRSESSRNHAFPSMSGRRGAERKS